MSGWKTWVAVIVTIIYAVGGFVSGLHDSQTMITLIIGALALLGIGGKLSKLERKF